MPGESAARTNLSQSSQKRCQPKMPSDELVQNDSRFDSRMEMTAWVLIVGNGSTLCVVHPEGTRIPV